MLSSRIVLAVGGMPNLLCRLYNTLTGSCLATLTGHDGEISKVSFNPQVRILQPGCQAFVCLG